MTFAFHLVTVVSLPERRLSTRIPCHRVTSSQLPHHTMHDGVRMSTGSAGAGRPGPARHCHYAHRVLHAMAPQASRVVLHWRDRAITAGEFAGSVVGAAAALHRA